MTCTRYRPAVCSGSRRKSFVTDCAKVCRSNVRNVLAALTLSITLSLLVKSSWVSRWPPQHSDRRDVNQAELTHIFNKGRYRIPFRVVYVVNHVPPNANARLWRRNVAASVKQCSACLCESLHALCHDLGLLLASLFAPLYRLLGRYCAICCALTEIEKTSAR